MSVFSFAEWLESIGMSQHLAAFERHGVASEDLTSLTDKDLRAIGVARLADRKAILRSIDRDVKGRWARLVDPTRVQTALNLVAICTTLLLTCVALSTFWYSLQEHKIARRSLGELIAQHQLQVSPNLRVELIQRTFEVGYDTLWTPPNPISGRPSMPYVSSGIAPEHSFVQHLPKQQGLKVLRIVNYGNGPALDISVDIGSGPAGGAADSLVAIVGAINRRQSGPWIPEPGDYSALTNTPFPGRSNQYDLLTNGTSLGGLNGGEQRSIGLGFPDALAECIVLSSMRTRVLGGWVRRMDSESRARFNRARDRCKMGLDIHVSYRDIVNQSHGSLYHIILPSLNTAVNPMYQNLMSVFSLELKPGPRPPELR